MMRVIHMQVDSVKFTLERRRKVWPKTGNSVKPAAVALLWRDKFQSASSCRQEKSQSAHYMNIVLDFIGRKIPVCLFK